MQNVFIETLEDLSGGSTALELHKGLTDLIGQVLATNKKGQLVLSITVKPGTSANVAQVLLVDEVQVKFPKVAREVSVFFADGQNRLSRNDPRQPKLFDPRPAPLPASVPVTVNQATGEIVE